PDDRSATPTGVSLSRPEGRARAVVARGGHPSPIVLRASGEVEEVGGSGMLLGVFEDSKRADASTELIPGDALVLYTDGLLDERQANPELRLLSIISEARRMSAAAMADRI